MASGKSDKNRRSVYFSTAVISLVERYAHENNRSFSKAVNLIIQKFVSDPINDKMMFVSKEAVLAVSKYAEENNLSISEAASQMLTNEAGADVHRD